MKKLFIIFSLLSIAIFSYTGCTMPYKNYTFQEKILSYYLDEDDETLVIIGEKYHYICTIDNENDRAFFAAQALLQYDADGLGLDILRQANNDLSVSMHATFTKSTLTSEQIAWLDTHMFNASTYDDDTYYARDLLFSGKAYTSKAEINAHVSLLPRTFNISVNDENDNIATPPASPLLYQDMHLELNHEILMPLF